MIRIGRLRRDRGFSVARPTALGNPFDVATFGREEAIARYRVAFPQLLETAAGAAQFARLLAAAREGDVTLLCWCAPLPCHADVIAEALRARLTPNEVEPGCLHT